MLSAAERGSAERRTAFIDDLGGEAVKASDLELPTSLLFYLVINQLYQLSGFACYSFYLVINHSLSYFSSSAFHVAQTILLFFSSSVPSVLLLLAILFT